MFGKLLGALALAAATVASAQAQPVKVGVVTTLSGPAATLGQQLRDGFALGIEKLGGKLGGMPVDATVLDDELKPDVAVTKVRGLLESGKADIVVGPIFSNILQAIFKPVTESGAILISPNAGPSTYAGRACAKNFFVTSYQNDQPHAVSGQYAQDSGYKRLFLLAPNYQAGRDALAGVKSKFKGEIVGEEYVPLTQMDFQSEIAKIAAAKPDAVYAFMPGGLGIALVKQYRQAGLANIPFLSAFTVDESTLPAQGDAAIGFYSGASWAPNMDNAANKTFVAAFEAKYGYVPGSYAAYAYDTAMLLDAAVKKAGGVADKAKLAAAIETADFASTRGAFKFGVNHYPVQDFYLVQVVKRADGKYQTETRKKVFTADIDPYAAQCKMN
ncbi:ABC transporter substrate-binding protein [Limobrevibacterium gyesilva]|uniref:ABC transporter substrate-binding protein n=1 Tax=Limobrevibacterium gyesilva TaxID=2991712 RepID=A0AA41YKG0_9PROT|nr:ABC transporter substrate-binding protein [Limobrevibacterium gyesilva]MCW3473503.1 ABC transporter substrate-binding protein [Limobrevibacterium gyesilva]